MYQGGTVPSRVQDVQALQVEARTARGRPVELALGGQGAALHVHSQTAAAMGNCAKRVSSLCALHVYRGLHRLKCCKAWRLIKRQITYRVRSKATVVCCSRSWLCQLGAPVTDAWRLHCRLEPLGLQVRPWAQLEPPQSRVPKGMFVWHCLTPKPLLSPLSGHQPKACVCVCVCVLLVHHRAGLCILSTDLAAALRAWSVEGQQSALFPIQFSLSLSLTVHLVPCCSDVPSSPQEC